MTTQKLLGLKLILWLFLLVFVLSPLPLTEIHAQTTVTETHLDQINRLFKQNEIRDGYVTRDNRGRVELQGIYSDEREVDLAFSLAQTVVGVKLVSPVTPENIKVKDWERCLERILSGEIRGRCGPEPITTGDFDGVPPPGTVANKYALVVGVGRFKNGIQPLEYASRDALNFYSYLVDPRGGNFRRENVTLLRDEYATRAAVINAMNRIRGLTGEDDLVVIYFSSHGTPPDKFGGVHVVTYDSEVKPRQRIWETSITEDILRDFVQGVKAKRLIVIMDACYSNGAYTQIAGFLPSGSKSLGAEEEGFGRSKKYMSQRLLGAKDIVLDEPTSVTQPQNSRLPNGWGKVLISASDAGERSWESDTLRSSIFTYYFLQGLRNYNGTVKESFDYSKPLVYSRVKQEKGIDIDQHPQLTPNRRDWNMSIAISGR